MIAEIISIGSELTSGQNLDTNSQWLSQRLGELGVEVHYHTTLADCLEENVAAFRVAAARAGLVVLTGGLGPTQDDLTRQALAQVAGVELELHQPSLDFIRHLFESRQRQMPERNRVQALFPRGAEVIPNPNGTAPGIWLELKTKEASALQPPSRALFIALPGVPREMHAMYLEAVQPRLRAWLGDQACVILERKLNCFGAGESMVEEKLLDLTRRGHEPEVGITASDAVISLRIRAKGRDEAAARTLIEPVERTIRDRLGRWVFGCDGEQLQDVVARLLLEQRQTVAIAESLTGGLVCELLSRVPGISASLLGGVVAYANSAKVSLLGVPARLIETHGAVSLPVAEAMAEGVRQRLGADWGVSTTGIAGPGGGSDAKPVGLVFVAVAGPKGVRGYQVNWFGSRGEIQSRSAKSALNALRLHLAGPAE